MIIGPPRVIVDTNTFLGGVKLIWYDNAECIVCEDCPSLKYIPNSTQNSANQNFTGFDEPICKLYPSMHTAALSTFGFEVILKSRPGSIKGSETQFKNWGSWINVLYLSIIQIQKAWVSSLYGEVGWWRSEYNFQALCTLSKGEWWHSLMQDILE